jgi:hypothetical protein
MIKLPMSISPDPGMRVSMSDRKSWCAYMCA